MTYPIGLPVTPGSAERRRTVAAALRAGEPVSGFMLASSLSPDFVQFLRPAPDFVVIELEHSHFAWSEVAGCLRILNLLGVVTIVRVPEIRYEPISKALDAGADGLLIPRIRDERELSSVVEAMRLPPRGGKGIGGYDFQTAPLDEKLRGYDREKLLLVQVENRESLANLTGMLGTGEVDGVVIGPFDLSQALGIPGEFAHPDFSAAVDAVVAACARAGVASGALLPSPELAADWRARGMTIAWFGTEVSLFTAGYARARAEFLGE